ncbi:23S rRNA (pseudouridine(1915)-N(3))-methyltransferase RlmH [Eubacterium oxidoreducens]|uniref:Ribosomal RNA large subunit methyltransferase H n=1 Tax=Eubacterium oxidoreducens TaxID=1732 RepID=A0A1G6BC38_EUBOX|nr:23S rRNA (pseudouridine(1915)-N(3))-methyltransferase RlmH [Eubacterium oxidoreducens]SDB18201.1 23S rRNA (pseudouridine1915-N3)-methyltransferase [Eubacterium oxidoreducens]
MKIDICCVGKIKEAYYKDAIKEYVKRLSRYTTLNILEVADEKTPDGISETAQIQIKDKEGERLMSKIKEEAYVIALAIDGTKKSSEKMARDLERLTIEGKSHIQFVIGGSLGLSNQVLKRADAKLSFSDLTFPHQLMRVILLEQIYRSFRIIHHEPYHK